jgi:hypothetical protein
LVLTTADVVVGELRNHATSRSGSRAFRTSLEARSEVEKKQPSYLKVPYLVIAILQMVKEMSVLF